jgi:hypothetical protein
MTSKDGSGRPPRAPDPALPVEPARLRRQFPGLTDEDLQAYAEVTRRILAARGPAERARLTREVLARGRQAREGPASSAERSSEDALCLRYLEAVEKMQGRTRP